MRPPRRLWGIGAAALVLAGVAPALGADLRIGYIDSAKIFAQYKAAQEAQERFDRQVKTWRDEADEKDAAVQKLRTEVRDQAGFLSATRRQEKEEALQKAISEYETFIQQIWGPEGRASQENARTTREIVDQIRAVVEKLAGDKGLLLVLDAAGGYLIFADRSLDLTADVLRELNTRYGTGTGTSP